MWIDKHQGQNDEGVFGYVSESGENGGGYFFTWMPTLDETLNSIEEDAIDPPRRMKLSRVEREVTKLWKQEADKSWGSLIPIPKEVR